MYARLGNLSCDSKTSFLARRDMLLLSRELDREWQERCADLAFNVMLVAIMVVAACFALAMLYYIDRDVCHNEPHYVFAGSS